MVHQMQYINKFEIYYQLIENFRSVKKSLNFIEKYCIKINRNRKQS